jgi:hypothetical protein
MVEIVLNRFLGSFLKLNAIIFHFFFGVEILDVGIIRHNKKLSD